ncbi:MAG TPA: hypothetical protein VFW11_19800 [Cyclobacteriaceae bacterium]|nr:hypothetical protein [Cyclobacteriaceae bacterium]
MKDRTLKYNEEYIRITVEDLKREFQEQISNLKRHHDEALSKWKKDPGLSSALEAAYHEELEQLKISFNDKVRNIQEEVDSLIDTSSQRLKNQFTLLRSKLQELFRFINQSVVIFLIISLLRPEDFFE